MATRGVEGAPAPIGLGTPADTKTGCCGKGSFNQKETSVNDNPSTNLSTAHDSLKEYYGKTLAGTRDLKTNACCTKPISIPPYIQEIVNQIAPEILDHYYGCGTLIPAAVEGCTVLDLGCGAGKDCYIFSKLVGDKGSVIGVDMTDEQIAIAQQHLPDMMEKFGFNQTPNVTFKNGYMEDLQSLGIGDQSVDVVISNCVFNLAPDKEYLFKEIFRVLKPGGELYFSDVFADRRVPESLKGDSVLQGECLGGAMYTEDFRRLLNKLGCPDSRVLSEKAISIDNQKIEEKTGNIRFKSQTIRAFKLDNLEDRCEDYGQIATYMGTIPGQPHFFQLDDHHKFEKDRPILVCGNTAAMVQDTRYSCHFAVQGNRETHFGLFDCAPGLGDGESASGGGACC